MTSRSLGSDMRLSSSAGSPARGLGWAVAPWAFRYPTPSAASAAARSRSLSTLATRASSGSPSSRSAAKWSGVGAVVAHHQPPRLDEVERRHQDRHRARAGHPLGGAAEAGGLVPFLLAGAPHRHQVEGAGLAGDHLVGHAGAEDPLEADALGLPREPLEHRLAPGPQGLVDGLVVGGHRHADGPEVEEVGKAHEPDVLDEKGDELGPEPSGEEKRQGLGALCRGRSVGGEENALDHRLHSCTGGC